MIYADFFKTVRASLFSGRLTQAQVDGMDGILVAFAEVGDGNEEHLAYALATAYHETGTRMIPVREGFAKSDAEARRLVARLGRRYAAPVPPYGHVYYGRGHVQLTWADNYRLSSEDVGFDLLANPDAVLEPRISARLLISGILDGRWNAHRKGISHYLGGPGSKDDDLRGARRTVNVTDRWELIGGHYRKFLAAAQAAGGIDPPPVKYPDGPELEPGYDRARARRDKLDGPRP